MTPKPNSPPTKLTPEAPPAEKKTPQAPSGKTKINISSLIIPVVAISVIGLNLVFGLLLKSTSSQGQVVVSHLEALRRNRQNIESLEQDLQTYAGKIAQLEEVLPRERDIPDFIQFITEFALAQGVVASLNFTSNLPSQSKDKLLYIPISIVSTGTNDNTLSFLERIQGEKYQIRFEHLELEAPTGQANFSVATRISGVLYVSTEFAKGGE